MQEERQEAEGQGLPQVGPAPGGWSAILTGPDAVLARAAGDRIARDIAAIPTGEEDPSLAGGQAGLALLYGYRAAVAGQEDDRRLARRYLGHAVTAMADVPLDASLWSGFPGIAWAVELVERWLGDGRVDRSAGIDDALDRMLARERLWPLPHDLVSGATGAAVYLLERRRSGHPAGTGLELVLDRLEGQARTDESGGVCWWTRAEEMVDPELAADYPAGLADLGAAHGLAGAIAGLAKVHGSGVGGTRAGRLLDGAVSWLQSQRLPDGGAEGAGPAYPMWVAPGHEPVPARSAWCYGDPGIAGALFVAGRSAGRADWAAEALGLARRAAARPEDETGVEDGAFCHGAAGLAHVYNRLYQTSGDETLGAAARQWLGRTLEFCARAGATGVAGHETDGPWDGLDVVDGAAGVALVLMAATADVEPSWDRMFLLS